MSKDNTKVDPFDPAALRVSANIEAKLGVRKIMAHLPVQKPNRQAFFRVHPDPEFRATIAILELKDEHEIYAVVPDIAYAIEGETRIVELCLCVTQQGANFLWPVPAVNSDARDNAWHRTARIAASHAVNSWVRMFANMGAGCYDIKLAPDGMPDPEWPKESFRDLLQIAFGNGKLIDSFDHPVIKRLMGN